MRRLLSMLCAITAVAIAITAWSRLTAGVDVPVPSTPPAAGGGAPPAGGTGGGTESDLDTALQTARRQCSLPALDGFVARAAAATSATPTDRAAWRALAEGHLERAQQRAHLRGMAIGEPLFPELPDALAADVRDGLTAVAKARELGDESGPLFRIEAGLLSQQITGFATALQWNGAIDTALTKAAERAADDPKLHVALGLRKLLAPRFLGNDPAKAIEHFTFAAEHSDDERPAVFAAMASWLQQKREQAIAWLERAVATNPANTFARVVLRRLVRGEADPFGRDVTTAEIAAAK